MKKRNRRSVTVLLSGGMDSGGCIHFYQRRLFFIRPLFVDYGQPAAKAELKSASAICAFYKLRLHTLVVKGFNVPPSGEIIGRNLMLVSCALVHAGRSANLIAIGIHRGTTYFDCGAAFLEICNSLLDGYADGRTRLAAPFLNLTKSEVWTYCTESKVPLHLTWSCEASSAKPCRKCSSCKDKESLLAST